MESPGPSSSLRCSVSSSPSNYSSSSSSLPNSWRQQAPQAAATTDPPFFSDPRIKRTKDFPDQKKFEAASEDSARIILVEGRNCLIRKNDDGSYEPIYFKASDLKSLTDGKSLIIWIGSVEEDDKKGEARYFAVNLSSDTQFEIPAKSKMRSPRDIGALMTRPLDAALTATAAGRS